MKIRKENKDVKTRKLKMLLVAGLLVLIVLIILVIAQSQEELQSELNSLINELTDSGYDWLVNQSVDYTEADARESAVGSGNASIMGRGNINNINNISGIEFDEIVDPGVSGVLYWVGKQNGNWSDASNWASSSGGAGGAGVPNATTDVVFDSANLNNSMINNSIAVYSINVSIGYNGTITQRMNWNLSINVTENVIISNGTFTHGDNSNAETWRVNLQVGGNFTLESGGSINVTGLGYDGQQGPGKSTAPCSSEDDGEGSYGGKGSTKPGITYGSVTSPINLGSGGCSQSGGGQAGGAIILNVTQSVNLSSSIIANANINVYHGGSGGSVYITTSNLYGSGIIDSSGGGTIQGGGGGGRIAIVLTNGTDFGNINITAYGRTGSGNNGAAGTIYLKTANQTYGQLIIDNNNTSTGAGITTLISENVTNTIVGDVIIRNKGFLSINSSNAGGTGYYPISLTIYGNFNKTSTGNFSAGVNSTVTLTGGIGDVPINTTFYSNESFYNLNITKRGGYVFFPAGWLMNVTGTFTVQGNSSNKAFLRSTVDGTQWKLNASGTNDVDYVDVKDSNASAGNVINAYLDSVNSGNNNNWVFQNYTSVCMNLSSTGQTYVLTQNIINNTITFDCIIVKAQNITLDCAGYSISSTQNYTGVYSNQYNTTVKNCNITMGSGGNTNAIGVEFASGANNGLIWNNSLDSGGWGVVISSAHYNNLTRNDAVSSAPSGVFSAIYIVNSNNNTLNSNTGRNNISGNGRGICLYDADNNSLVDNIGVSNLEYAIFVYNSDNNILIGNNGTSSTSSYANGIRLELSSNNNLTSNTGTSNSNVGIYLYSSSNNTLTSNTGTSNSSYGIYLDSSSNNNNLTSNTGTSNSSYGIYLVSSSNNNILTSNTGTSNSSYGIYLESSKNNILNNTRAEGYLSGSRGIAFRNANNTIIQDCINVSGFSGDVLYVTATSSNNTFINCSYRTTGTNETVMAGGDLIRKWYYRAYVNDSSGTAVSNANVSAYNVSGSMEFAGLLTNSSGWTNITTITEYVNVGGTRVYYNNYNINATYGSSMANKTYNVTAVNGTGGINNNLNDVISFSNTSGVTSTCMNLTIAGLTYTLSSNIINNTITNDCIIVKNQNITLDCVGYSISSTQNYTGVYSNQWNTTVKNCNVSMGTGGNTNAIGIEMTDAADYSSVINNTIIGEMDYGISFAPGNNGPENSLIENNTIDVSLSGIATTGIYLYTASNNTLKNNNATTLAEFGIYLVLSSNNNITGNTGTSNSSQGLRLDSSSNNNLTSNTGTSNSSYGIYLDSSSNNTLTSNTGTSNSNAGIYFSSTASFNNIINSIGITNATDNAVYAINIDGSNNSLINCTGNATVSSGRGIGVIGSNNSLINCTGISYGNVAVYFQGNSNIFENIVAIGGGYGIYGNTGDNNQIINCLNVTGTTSDIGLIGTSTNNTFINCSYRITGTNENVEAGSQLIRKWYYRAYVNDSSGTAVSNANVSAYNVSGATEFSGLITNSSGWTNRTTITEYVNTGGTRVYYSNYVVNATNGSVAGRINNYNVTINTNNLAHNVMVSNVPVLSFVSPSVGSMNYSNKILINVSVSDDNLLNVSIYLFNSTQNLVNSTIGASSVLYVNFSVINLADGLYYYNASANDSSGNTGYSSLINFTLDKTYPLINYGALTAVDYANVSRNWIYINVSITETNPDNITFNLYNSSIVNINSSLFFMSDNNANVTINFTNLNDGVYYYNITIIDKVGNINYTLTRKITLDTTYPLISYDVAPASNSYTNNSYLFVNVSVNELNFKNITFLIYNLTSEYNKTVYTSLTTNINWSFGANGNYTYNVSICDIANNCNNTLTYNIIFDNTPPNVTLYSSGMPSNNSVGGSSVLYNWSVSDNIDTNLSCYPMQGNTLLTLKYVANGTNTSASETLAGGQYALKVRCFDDANNSGDTLDSITYLVAVINLSSPAVNNASYRTGESVTLFLQELDGTDFLTMNNFRIKNESNSVINDTNATQVQTNNWSFSYTLPAIEPQYLTAIATAFNNSIGETQNVSQTKGLILLRASGTTSLPLITKTCSNQTYVINGSSIIISAVADLDTLIYNSSLVVRDPDGINYTLVENSSVKNSGFVYLKNYTFSVNKTGTYIINFSVEDYEHNNISNSYNFYSASGFNRYRINATRITNMSVQDVCDNSDLNKGNDITVVVPSGALYNLNVSISSPYLNSTSLELRFVNLNISQNISEMISFTGLTNETSAPTGQRRAGLFEINSTNLSYSNYSLVYDYSAIEYTLNDESTLKLWKCDSLNSCSLADTNAAINTTANKITAVLTNLSVFMVTESGTTTQTVTTTVSSGGGRVEVYKSLNIITPGTVEIGSKEKIIVPINLENPETSSLKGIKLNATPNTKDLSSDFDKKEIDELKPKTNKTVFLYLESHSTPGEYDVDIRADVADPKFSESVKLYVKLVEMVGKEIIMERIVLAQDLFKENPECLELNDVLIEAQKKLDSGDVNNSRELVQNVIYKCKDLVTSKEKPMILKTVKEWKGIIIIVLIGIVISLIIAIIIRKTHFKIYEKEAKKGKRKLDFSLFKKREKGEIRAGKARKSFFGKRSEVKKQKKDIWTSE